ncbi:MAG TPA: cell wall hydrolase [Candidatus Mediterraneibacter intestinipullorum]|nr:cell wall hydrolase [Candidatus Mediterraneibacter intestinipullorum]
MKLYKKRWIRSGIVLVSSLAIVLSVFTSFADEDISSLEGQTATLQNELEGINGEILSLSEEISTAEMQIEILNGEIARTSDALAEAVENESQQYENMKSRIKYMYEHGSATLLEMLFSAENMTDFLNKADFIENLSEYDRKALDDLMSVHQQIESQKETLEIQQESLKEIRSGLSTRQTELQAKAEATSTNLADVQARLEQARAESAAQETISSGGGYDNSIVNGGGIDASTDEVTLLAAILQCEARQDYDSLLAVATVIMNRVESPRFPNTISGVIYANGQFEPVWTGRLQAVLNTGPTGLSLQVAQDAVNGARLAAVADCYFFLYAGATNRPGVNIGGNLFFRSW